MSDSWEVSAEGDEVMVIAVRSDGVGVAIHMSPEQAETFAAELVLAAARVREVT